jgi:hypothetical protein
MCYGSMQGSFGMLAEASSTDMVFLARNKPSARRKIDNNQVTTCSTKFPGLDVLEVAVNV